MRYIHFNDNSQLDYNDRLTKIRPYLDHLNQVYQDYAVWETESSIDEAMIPYFGRHGLKQCIRGKPIRFGYKAWCHNQSLGYLLNFDVYQGAGGIPNNYREDFGLGGSVLLKFSDSLPKHPDGFYVPHYTQITTSHRLLSLKNSQNGK